MSGASTGASSGACLGYYLGHVRGMNCACLAHNLGMSGACLGHAWSVSETCLEHVWDMSGASSGAYLGHHLGHVWGIIRGMSGASSGACMGHVWHTIWCILSTMDNNPRCYMHLWCRFFPLIMNMRMSHLSLGVNSSILLFQNFQTFKPPLIIRLSLITASRVMIGMSHLSLGVNSSINFLIYYSLGININDQQFWEACQNRWILGKIPREGVISVSKKFIAYFLTYWSYIWPKNKNASSRIRSASLN